LNEILSSLLLDLTGLSDHEAEDLTFQEYVELYLDKGVAPRRIGNINTHDGSYCTFTESRFEHAFFTSAYKTIRQFNKDQFDKRRAERIRWIGEIIRGNINGVEYCHIPDPRRCDSSGNTLIQRLYVLWEENYLIWLEPSKTHGWWFSSAYIETKGKRRIRDIIRGCVCKKISRD
jgi:hypothetical protein